MNPCKDLERSLFQKGSDSNPTCESNIVYFLPCKPGSVYVSVTDDCLNNCLFCIKRDGPIFFGYNLSLGRKKPESSEIIASLKNTTNWPAINEVVFCGMGEPLLRYDCIKDVCVAIKDLRGIQCKIRVDTSGLFWANTKRLDILDCIDVLSISLNAENADKYEMLCKPNIKNSYDVLMDFLKNIKRYENAREKQGLHFPEVRLSVVNTSEEQFIPISGRSEYVLGTFPIPDFKECEKIANSFGWQFIIKRLFRDSRDKRWNNRSFEELCARGISLYDCKNCSFRH